MIFPCFAILVILTISATSDCNYNAAATFLSNVTDRQALLSVRTYITGHPPVLSSWNNSIHFCHWEGVICSRRHQRVMVLNLSSQQLEGTLSPHIGNLSFLRAIFLDGNTLRGFIPVEIGKLFRLRHLYLGSNFFQGRFPMSLSYCLELKSISIPKNSLKGNLPEFTSWSKLTSFNALKNNFTGPIPSSIGNMSSLQFLDLGGNFLTGSIPLEVSDLSKLEYLQLAGNNLSGKVPVQLYNISSLSSFSLAINELLEGNLPADLGSTLPNLQVFFAGGNSFSGPFPPSITNASQLVLIDIAYNYIVGPLPMNLGSLRSLEEINLGDNKLGINQQPGDLGFLDSLVNSTGLEYVGLNENGFSGEIPSSIVNLSTTLDGLSLYGNNIYGSIPREIGNLLNITELSLSENMLTGSIPASICKLSKLGSLSLGNNNISGVIPACIGNITGLLLLSLESNMLHETIPPSLFNISSLQELRLFSNLLSGMIPEHIGLSSLSRGLFLQQNLLTGPLPSNIGSLIHLVKLRVSDNRLTGVIPASLRDCVMLEELLMEGNLFDGSIPSSLKGLRSLAFLDLSNNNISGNIPRFLGELPQIQFLNLSHNKLGGDVPKKGLFSNVSAFSIVGNFQLCGGIQALKLRACPANISKTKEKQFPLRILPLIIVLPLAALFAFFAFGFYQIKKSKKKNAPILVLPEEKYPRISYQDLLLATDNFSPNNWLGGGKYGSVYKGIMDSSQQNIAVKVLNIEVHGANKNFLVECETLRIVRHRNLIKIITACSSTDFKGNDFKALVFELMKNGSLDNWLHPSLSNQETERNLTLLQRLDIAIDVASAVDYLHHQCPTKILHSDIKPSNILLDEELVARVGDFGLARILLTSTGDINNQAQSNSNSTGVRGTVGYVPPGNYYYSFFII
nr:PREDICTED: LRR receptor-like serine/threonine-protein kinase EFR [Daucus carota subsp. sativus]